jgi:hypothetical protein
LQQQFKPHNSDSAAGQCAIIATYRENCDLEHSEIIGSGVIRLVGYWQSQNARFCDALVLWKSKLLRTRKLVECPTAREGRVAMAGAASHRVSTSKNLDRDKTMLVLALEASGYNA